MYKPQVEEQVPSKVLYIVTQGSLIIIALLPTIGAIQYKPYIITNTNYKKYIWYRGIIGNVSGLVSIYLALFLSNLIVDTLKLFVGRPRPNAIALSINDYLTKGKKSAIYSDDYNQTMEYIKNINNLLDTISISNNITQYTPYEYYKNEINKYDYTYFKNDYNFKKSIINIGKKYLLSASISKYLSRKAKASFPSGHSAQSFSIFLMIALILYRKHKYLYSSPINTCRLLIYKKPLSLYPIYYCYIVPNKILLEKTSIFILHNDSKCIINKQELQQIKYDDNIIVNDDNIQNIQKSILLCNKTIKLSIYEKFFYPIVYLLRTLQIPLENIETLSIYPKCQNSNCIENRYSIISSNKKLFDSIIQSLIYPIDSNYNKEITNQIETKSIYIDNTIKEVPNFNEPKDNNTESQIVISPITVHSWFPLDAYFIFCILPIFIAVFISSSRIHDNYHHISDVVCGSVIGIGFALLVYFQVL